MMKQMILTFLLIGSMQFLPVHAAGAKVLQETLEAAAKVSGKVLSSQGKTAVLTSLRGIFSKYGDDALRIVRQGGLETLRAGAKYGDDFWRLAKNASPSAARSLALHADDLMPVAKRLGSDFIKLEGKAPGLGIKVISEFGDDAGKMLAKKASSDDIAQLLGYAAKADSPAAKKALIRAYEKKGAGFLKHLDWKRIMAGGLSVAVVTAAYKTSDGIEEGLKTIAEKEPERFVEIIKKGMFWGILPFVLIVIILMLPIIVRLVKWSWRRLKKVHDLIRNDA